MELLRYKTKAFGALAVKLMPLFYGGAVILFVNTHLSRETELGIYSLAIATFFVVSFLGKSFALYPLIKYLAEGDTPRGIWSAGASYWIGIQIIGAILIWMIAPATPQIFHAPGLAAGMHWTAWIILAFIPRDLATALLIARREVGRLFVIEFCYFGFAAAGIVILAISGKLQNADQVLALNLAGATLSSAAAPWLCWKRIPGWEKPPRQIWQKSAKYGRDTLGIGIGDLIYTQLDYHLLGFFLGASEVALYFAAKNFFRFYNALTQAINLLMLPTSSNLFARGETGKLKELIEKVLGGYAGFLLMINIFLLIGADWIVAVVYRGIFPDAANILRLFILASFFEPFYVVGENVLYGIGKPKAILVAVWSSFIVYVILALILIPHWGAIGAVCTVLGTLMSLATIILLYLRRELGVTPVTICDRCIGTAKALLGRH